MGAVVNERNRLKNIRPEQHEFLHSTHVKKKKYITTIAVRAYVLALGHHLMHLEAIPGTYNAEETEVDTSELLQKKGR